MKFLWWMALIAFVMLLPVIVPCIWGIKLVVRLGLLLCDAVILH